MTKISQLSQDTTPQSGDQVAIVDSISGATKRMTFSDLSKIMQTLLMPSGIIQECAMAVPPSGWLICDGSPISRTTYAALFTAIGTTYGAGNGSTTFNIPDFRGRVALGSGTGDATGATAHALGSKAGEETHTLTVAEMPNHDHGANGGLLHTGGSGYTHVAGGGSWNFATMGGLVIAAQGGGAAHNNLTPATTVNYIIKT